MTDDNGYPTDEELDEIRKAPHDQVLRLARALWYYPEYWTTQFSVTAGSTDTPRHKHLVSTGGWSGNESVIDAMQDNALFWAMHWEQSRRGGHYIFRETP